MSVDGKIRKAVIPVAGFGTRMLPASKAIPKEMLPVVDKPVIQYAVEEAAAAGLTEIMLVTHPSKKAIEDHFDTVAELEAALAAKGKSRLLEVVRSTLPGGVHLARVFQDKAHGLGHAVACAGEWVGDEPFAVLLPDVLLDGPKGTNDLAAMIHAFTRTGHAQVMVEEVPPDRVDQYGIVSLASAIEQPGEGVTIRTLVEKPPVGSAPSRMAVVGRYVLPAAIMPLLRKLPADRGGEIQLTDAINALLRHCPVDAWRMMGSTFDCGSKAGYLEAILHFGLRHAEVSSGLRVLMEKSLAEEGS
jgi:UTP--glucose-1-phosphate uridylyltransferase